MGQTESLRQLEGRSTLAELVKDSSKVGGRAWGLAESSDLGAVAGSEMPPGLSGPRQGLSPSVPALCGPNSPLQLLPGCAQLQEGCGLERPRPATAQKQNWPLSLSPVTRLL